MKAYRWAWTCCWGAVAVLACCLGPLFHAPEGAIGYFAVGAAFGGGIALCRRHMTDPLAELSHLRGSYLIRPSLTGGLITVGAGALITATGQAAWSMLLLAAASSPWAVFLMRRALQRSFPPPPTGHHDRQPAGRSERDGALPASSLRSAIRNLTDAELCRAWRASFTALECARTADAREVMAGLRGEYLDELERRHPRGVRAWLASGARAASDPSRYFEQDGTGGPPTQEAA